MRTRQHFLSTLKASGHLSSYSLQLHDKFVCAATELCGQCGLQLSELDLLYWQPTQTVVTVVIRVSSTVGERVEKTTNCRFVAQSSLYAAVSCMADDVDGKQWVDELIHFHARSTLPPPAPAIPTPSLLLPPPAMFRSSVSSHAPPHSSADAMAVSGGSVLSAGARPTLSARIKRFFANTVSPAPSPRSAAISAMTTSSNDAVLELATSSSSVSTRVTVGGVSVAAASSGYKLYLGLYYVKVEASGLQVMILCDGPLHHIPVAAMLDSATPFDSLSADHIGYLRDLRFKHVEPEMATPRTESPTARKEGREKKVREAGQGDGTGRAEPGVARGLTSARPHMSNSRTPSASVDGDDEVDDDNPTTARGERAVRDKLRQLRTVNSTPLDPPSPHSTTNAGSRPHAAPLSVDLLTFTTALEAACRALGELLGTSSDLQPANLHHVQLLPYGPRDWVLAFNVVRMSSKLDQYSKRVRCVSLKTFEILHYARHNSRREEGKGWTGQWVKQQTGRALSRASMSGVSDSYGDGSGNERVVTGSEALKASNSPLLTSHQRGPSTSHHRTDSTVSQSRRIALPIAHSQTLGPGSLPNSTPTTARA